MPVQKIDPKIIFASNAPSQDKPAAFVGYEKGMDATRANEGRPTIKQANYLQQTTDQKILWMHENGAALPYDGTIDYADGAVVVKDGELQRLVEGQWIPAVKNLKGVGEPYSEGETYNIGDEVRLDNGEKVQSAVPNNTTNPNSDMTGWFYLFKSNYGSIAEMIAIKTPRNGQIVNVASYHLDQNIGGDLFMWRSDLSKSSHDGGYIIDPLIPFPALSSLDAYYTPVNTGTGVWVRMNNKELVAAENFGAIPLSTFTLNHAAIQAALYKAASGSTIKNVSLSNGVYRCSGHIIISTYPAFGNTIRVPKLIGAGRTNTEIWKVANSIVPDSIYRTNHTEIDCIVLAAGRLDNASENIIGGGIEGIQFMRTGHAAGTGFGVYRKGQIYYDCRNVSVISANHGWYQDDCWMGQVNDIRVSNYGAQAFSILGGTSVTGRNLYAETGQGSAFDLSRLNYSDLGVHADGGGQGSANGVPCIKATGAVGLKLTASTESHKGTEFDFTNCEGVTINGNSYNTTAVATGSVPKVRCVTSNVMFDGYSWQRSLNQLNATEAAKYTFFTRDNNTNLQFRACRLSSVWTDYNQYVSDFRYIGDLKFQAYSEENRRIVSVVTLATNTWKKLCYLGDANRFVIKQGITTATTQDRIYTFPTLGHVKSGISTSSVSPTPLSTHIYINGVVDSADGGTTESQRYQLKGYMGTDGWLYVATTTEGNNLEYVFEIAK